LEHPAFFHPQLKIVQESVLDRLQKALLHLATLDLMVAATLLPKKCTEPGWSLGARVVSDGILQPLQQLMALGLGLDMVMFPAGHEVVTLPLESLSSAFSYDNPEHMVWVQDSQSRLPFALDSELQDGSPKVVRSPAIETDGALKIIRGIFEKPAYRRSLASVADAIGRGCARDLFRLMVPSNLLPARRTLFAITT
jgi:hypothetical protein